MKTYQKQCETFEEAYISFEKLDLNDKYEVRIIRHSPYFVMEVHDFFNSELHIFTGEEPDA